jgi:hypothetical protein
MGQWQFENSTRLVNHFSQSHLSAKLSQGIDKNAGLDHFVNLGKEIGKLVAILVGDEGIEMLVFLRYALGKNLFIVGWNRLKEGTYCIKQCGNKGTSLLA